jgi:PAS domain S-box-containing protein
VIETDEGRGERLPSPLAVRLLPRAIALAVCAIGVSNLVGWATSNQTLIRLSPALPTLKLNTSICLIALALATWCATCRRGRAGTTVLATAAFAVMLATLVEWVSGHSLGIDQYLGSAHVHESALARTSAYTAVVLCLLAAALVTVDSRAQRLHRTLMWSAVAMALQAGFAYAYGAHYLRGASSPSGIAVLSIVSMVLLCIALLTLRIERPPLSTLLRRDAAGELTRKLLPTAVLALVVIAAASLIGQQAGLYGTRVGLALLTSAMVVVLSVLVLGTARAVAAREDAQLEAESAASYARQELDGFFASALELMVIADAEGHFVRVNPQFETTLGYSPAELMDRPFTDFIHPDDVEATNATYARQMAGGDIAGFENRYRCKDGSYRDLLWSATANDARGLIYATARDMTERNLMEDELRASREQALQASLAKSDFVASMSHELRTPLNGVIGLTGLLGNTALDQVQRDYVTALGASGDALLAVISDVLDFSKMEAGRLELDPADFALRSTVEDATAMLAEQAHAKGLEISHWVDDDVPLAVNGDRDRLRQILLNLLSNAVKFTAAGEIIVRVVVERPGLLRFSVLDTGIGIDAEQAVTLFEAFAQADLSITRQYGGTGLGLAISRRLVELMGGDISAVPREGGGSVFSFTAELAEALDAAALVRPRPELQARRTLVVDDSPTNRTILEYYLRGWGLACESVDRPSAALGALDQASREGQPFELAMLDVNMPQMDGVELVREIRRRPALGALRIVVLSSATLRPSDWVGIGVSATLTKPARQSAIYDAIAEAFTGPGHDIGFASRARPSSADRGLTVLIAEDNEINHTVASGLLSALGLRTEWAHDGQEAIDMVAAGNYAAIFMDCQMPGVDGFEATRQIRDGEEGVRVPIIAMTAFSLPGDRERCLATGMDDYLSKPIRREEAEAVIARWLPTSRSSTSTLAVTQALAQPVAAAAPSSVLDEKTIGLLRKTLSEAARGKLIDTFETQQDIYVAQLTAAMEQGDREEVRRLAHKLKGSSASLGATRVRQCCQLIGDIGWQNGGVGAAQITELRVAAAEATEALRHELV